MSTDIAITGAAASSLAECVIRLDDPRFFRRVAGITGTPLNMRDLPSRETIRRYSTPPQAVGVPKLRVRMDGYRPMTPVIERRVVAMAPTHTTRQIAEATGCSYSTVAGVCRKHSVRTLREAELRRNSSRACVEKTG